MDLENPFKIRHKTASLRRAHFKLI